MTKKYCYELGILAVEFQFVPTAAAGAVEPFLVIGVYRTPATPRNNHLRDRIDDELLTFLGPARAAYRHRLALVGDFNAGLPSRIGGRLRTTTAATTGVHGAAKLCTLCVRLRLEPAHGRPGQVTSGCRTSRSITAPARPTNEDDGGAESDYIFIATELSNNDIFIHPPQPWSEVDSSITHRGLAMRFNLTPCAASVSSNTAAPANAQPARLGWKLPAHSDVNTWAALSGAQIKHFSAQLSTGSYAGNDAQELVARFNTAMTASLDETLERKKPPRTSMAFTRFFDNDTPSRASAALFNEARRIRHQYLASPTHALKAELRAAETAARKSAQKDLAKRRAEILMSLSNDRIRVPHRHWLYVNQHLSGSMNSDDRGKIPDGPVGSPPATERFRDFFNTGGGGLGTRRPDPDAIRNPEWFNLVKTHPSAGIARHFTGPELCRLYWPAMVNFLPGDCPATGNFEPNCDYCVHYSRQHALFRQPAPNKGPAPKTCASLSTSVSSGCLFTAEFIKWARPTNRVLDHRLAMAEFIARVLNAILDSGSMPTECITYRTTPVIKVPKDGSPVDASDPSKYRPITISGLLAKLMSIALCSRLYHWTALHNIIDKEQAAFKPLVSGDTHVWSLIECIKHRWRSKLSTVCSFIDFRQAYDRVPYNVMNQILVKMGLPPLITNLLNNWNSSRRTRVQVNDVATEPFAIVTGIGQGDPCSPLLFSLYMNSLSEYMRTRADVPGVAIGNLTIRQLLFADDIVLLSPNAATAQTALRHVETWANAWGMEIGLGAGKTQVMHFPPVSKFYDTLEHAPLPNDVITLANGATVEWTRSYTYLGVSLRPDLCMSQLVDRIVSGIQFKTAKYLHYSSFTTSCGAVFSEVCNTAVFSAANYGIGLIDASEDDVRRIDVKIKMATQQGLRRPFKSRVYPSSATWMDSRSPSATSILMRDRARLLLSLQLSPLAGKELAPQLLRVFAAEAADLARARSVHSGKYRNVTTSWYSRTLFLLSKNTAVLNVGLPVAAGYLDVSRAASVYGRAVAFREWQASALRARPPGWTALQPPPGGNILTHLASTLNTYIDAAELGNRAQSTPLSRRGPMCSGNLYSLLDRVIGEEAQAAIQGASIGRRAFFHYPLAPTHWRGIRGENQQAFEAMNHPGPCHLCQAAGATTPLSEFHLIAECPHPFVVAQRDIIIAGARRKTVDILRAAVCARYYSSRTLDSPPEPPGIDALAAICQALANQADFTSDYGKFLLYRLVTASPWGRNDAAITVNIAAVNLTARLVVSLGLQFDNTNVDNRYARLVSRSWYPWAATSYMQLARRWTTMVQNLALERHPQVPPAAAVQP